MDRDPNRHRHHLGEGHEHKHRNHRHSREPHHVPPPVWSRAEGTRTPPGLRSIEYVVGRPLIPPHPDPDASRNIAKGEADRFRIPPHSDPNASRNPGAGQHGRRPDPTRAYQYHPRGYENEYDEDSADQEHHRDSRSYHPGGMGTEWAREQAIRTAQEVAENLDKEKKRVEREARKAAEKKAAEKRAAEERATDHHRRASGHHHHNIVTPTPVEYPPEGYVAQQQYTHARYLEEQAEREHRRRRR